MVAKVVRVIVARIVVMAARLVVAVASLVVAVAGLVVAVARLVVAVARLVVVVKRSVISGLFRYGNLAVLGKMRWCRGSGSVTYQCNVTKQGVEGDRRINGKQEYAAMRSTHGNEGKNGEGEFGNG